MADRTGHHNHTSLSRIWPSGLPASAPHSSLGTQADVFDRFVGTWDSEYVAYAADGTATRRRGEVIFGWIIDGRALTHSRTRLATTFGGGITVRIYNRVALRGDVRWTNQRWRVGNGVSFRF